MYLRSIMLVIPILIISFFLRFYNLSGVPPSLNWDEISHGYNAYSILLTGHDEWGKFLPVTNFRAYGDYPLPLSMYLMIPGISLLGLNEFTVRLPSAAFGSLMALIVYLLTLQLLKKRSLALLAAFLVSLSPWNLLTSRQAVQAIPAVFLLSFGLWLLIKSLSLKDGNPQSLHQKSDLFRKELFAFGGAITTGLSAYTYHNTRILTPLILLLFILIFWKIFLINKRILVLIIIIAGVFFLPLIPVVFSPEGSARANWVGILDQGAVNSINEQRGNTSLPSPFDQLVYNKATYFTWRATTNYLGYFSPIFLGFQGGTQYQFSIPHFGVIYPIELPFFYLGLIGLFLGIARRDNEKKFLLAWLLVAPLPAAITRDSYQVLRSMLMMPAVYIVIGLGFGYLLDFFKKRKILQKLFAGIFLVMLIIFATRYYYNLLFIYPKQYSFAWQYGYKQAVEYVGNNISSYSKIVMTKKYGEAHEFLLFYLKYDPLKYTNDPSLVRYEKSNWFWVDRFDKFEFINDEDIKDKLVGRHNVLLVTTPGNYPQNAEVLKTIDFLDGSRAFDIVAIE